MRRKCYQQGVFATCACTHKNNQHHLTFAVAAVLILAISDLERQAAAECLVRHGVTLLTEDSTEDEQRPC